MKRKPKYRALLVSISLSLLILLIGIVLAEDLNSQKLLSKLFWPLSRLMIFICIGLLAGQIIEASGWTRFLAAIANPFFKFGNLGTHCSAAFTTAFFSGVAANAMLLEFYKENKINRMQLYLSNLVNQLPAYFLHLPTTFFIVVPLVGRAGILYFAITLTATLLRTICFLVFGHLHPALKATADADRAHPDIHRTDKSKRGLWQGIWQKLPARIINIAVYVLPIYVLVFVLNSMGLFKLANRLLSQYVVTTLMPVESLSVVILSFAAEFTSGFAAAGALMDAGILTVKQTVLALLIGNVIAFPIRALRHQLPRYIGIFSPKMGTQLLLMGQGFRVISLIIVGYLYYYVA
jgi:hypothetical protein